MIGCGFGFNHLAAERIRHEQRLSLCKGNAVAALADVIDAEKFSHGARR